MQKNIDFKIFQLYTNESKTPFPAELKQVCEDILTALKFVAFEPQAAIVNYYKCGDTLSC